VSESLDFDPERSWLSLERRMREERNPRARQLLGSVRDHMRAEIRGELEPLMATLIDEPQYHFFGLGPDMAPKGGAAVRAFYEQMIAGGGNRFEFQVERIVVDADSVITEGSMRQVVAGSAVIAAGVNEVDGAPVEAGRDYLGETWILTVWPAAPDGRLIGEDIWFGSPPMSRFLSG
jgi:limonene-1,2-epoxide hydrolase